MPMIVIKAAL